MEKRIRTRLIDERKYWNWSQQEVADRVGTTQNNVSRWELGLTTPGAYFSAKLCELFGKNLQELGLLEEQILNRSMSNPLPDISSSTQNQYVPLWTVPNPRNPHFTGREEVLHQLAQFLSPAIPSTPTLTHRTALVQTQALTGLGGIGKTQIAVEYAYRSREQGHYTHTLWINAASEEAIITSFITLAEALPDFPAKNETEQRKLVAAVKRWLEQCQQHWLLIFDNVDDISFLQDYLPQQGNGSILLTTRVNAVGSLATSIEVEAMSFMEGTHLLLHRTQRLVQSSDEEINEAGNIVVALDHFPLSLDQAGAYIDETGCSFRDYLQIYQKHRQELLARRGKQATGYPDSVATTWSLSFQKIEQANPAAAELLRLCAMLAPDHIPEELIKNGAPHWPHLLQQAAMDLFTFNRMLEDLLTFSLVRRLAEDHLLSIHRLVQVVQRDAMKPEEQAHWAERVVRAVHGAFPRDPKNEVASWPQCLLYLEQAQTCDTLIQQYQILLPEGIDLLNRAAIYLREHALYTLAESLFQRAQRIREQQVGPENDPLYGLAVLYSEQGQYKEAEALYLRVLQLWELQRGAEHPQLAYPLNNLARIYGKQAKYGEAEALCQRALQIRELHLEPEHPDIAASLNTLAGLYNWQGKYAEAEPLYLRSRLIWEQTLGSEHPQVATSLDGLANLYYSQGKYAEAEQLCQKALQMREHLLGSEHPHVLNSRNNLANLYQEQGKYAEAEILFRQTLQILEQQLGPEHQNVAGWLNNLANLYSEQGKYAEAEPLYQRSLLIWERQLGNEHPDLAHPLTGLANLYRAQGNYPEATLLFQRALSIRESSLPAPNPYTGETLYGLAELEEAQGNFQEAESYYQRTLMIREQVLGAHHPKTIAIQKRLQAMLMALNPVDGQEK